MRLNPDPLPRTRSLRTLNSIAAIALTLLLTACDTDQAIHKVFKAMSPPSPSEVARDAIKYDYDPDASRRAISLLSASKFGGEKPYVQLYRLLIDLPDATIRAACVKALGEHGTVNDAKLLIARLHDDVDYVRWEAAKALIRIHNPIAVAPLLDATKDEDADVRMASAAALGQYAESRVVNVLIGLLDDHDFGVVNSAHDSLHTLTGQEFGTDGPDWLQWADANRADLFKDQQLYVYMPYVQPPSLWVKIQFWKKPPPEAQPQVPVGMQAAATTQPAPQS